MKIRAFITHKDKEYYKDCQDRFSVSSDTKSVAVSDGMTHSLFPGIWAEYLASTYTRDLKWYPNDENITELSELWLQRVKDIIENETRPGPKRNGKNALARREYAGATLAGLRIERNECKGLVLGDSCVLLIKEDGTIAEFHTSQEDDFDNFPDHFGSNPDHARKGNIKDFEFTLQENDKVLLISDPFSEYLANKKKTNEESVYIKELLDVNTQKEFEALVDNWRNQGMHNDDSTLVVLDYENNEDWTPLCITDINALIEEEAKTITTSTFTKGTSPKATSGTSVTEIFRTENKQTKINKEQIDQTELLRSILEFLEEIRKVQIKQGLSKFKKFKSKIDKHIKQIREYFDQCNNQQ